MTTHVPSKEFKPVYGGPLPCHHAPLAGELRLNNGSRGLYQAIAYVGGVHISLGVFCRANAACRAIVEAVGGEA